MEIEMTAFYILIAVMVAALLFVIALIIGKMIHLATTEPEIVATCCVCNDPVYEADDFAVLSGVVVHATCYDITAAGGSGYF
jgi:hypothetical protein